MKRPLNKIKAPLPTKIKNIKNAYFLVGTWKQTIFSSSEVFELIRLHGGSIRHCSGTNFMRFAGLQVSNTAGGWNLVSAWYTAAKERGK